MHRRIEALLKVLSVFQSVTLKLQLEDLTLADIRALFDSIMEHFPTTKAKLSATATIRKRRDDDGKEEDFATSVLRAKKARGRQTSASYSKLLEKLPPTSNRCERLFSQAKLVLTPQRASLLPVNFEMLMFLRANRSYWDMGMVQDVYQQM
eukprot:jgi/Phyca11/113634/e_gw1.24.525.1